MDNPWIWLKRWSLYIGLLLATFIVVVDRIHWAGVAQWREDQATNLWLGYTHSLFSMPVGLATSMTIPNPNGMVLLGKILSVLPGLLTVSAGLGCAQAFLAGLLAWQLFGRSWLTLVISGPVLASVTLRSAGVELWNQWIMILVNLFFFNLLVWYLKRPGPLKLPLLLIPILMAPGLYLVGVVNSIAFVLITGIVLLKKPPAPDRRHRIVPVLILLSVVGLALIFTWIPYFHAVEFQQVFLAPQDNLLPFNTRLIQSLQAVVTFPKWFFIQWFDFQNNFSIQQGAVDILSNLAGWGIVTESLLHLIQAALFLLTAALVIARVVRLRIKDKRWTLPIHPHRELAANVVGWSILFVVVSYALSPLLGGFNWAANVRIDQAYQFLPFFFFVWFITPLVFRMPNLMGKILATLTICISILYVVVGLVTGWLVVQSHLDYRGAILSPSDVPLVNKIQAVDFIAQDWLHFSGVKTVPVEYALTGLWVWVPELDQRLEKWYPNAPMTVGRSLDYDLLRRYGLVNTQEGKSIRTLGPEYPGQPRFYIVSYAFDPPPEYPGYQSDHYLLGRIRVSILQPG